MEKKTLRKIRKLAGPITEDQLRYVDCAVSDTMGIFIPSTGQCGYVILPQQIALKCGYTSTAHFSSTFSKLVGVSPLQYRRNIS